MSCSGERGHALIARELYLPQEWAQDRMRRAGAAIPPAVPFAWVVGDEVYGLDRRLRIFLEEHERPFVLAVRRNEKLWSVLDGRLGQHAAADLAAALPSVAWQRLSAGAGTKGERVPAEGEGSSGGVELDYTLADGLPCGATVIGYRRNGWSERVEELAGIAGKHLAINPRRLAGVIRTAFA